MSRICFGGSVLGCSRRYCLAKFLEVLRGLVGVVAASSARVGGCGSREVLFVTTVRVGYGFSHIELGRLQFRGFSRRAAFAKPRQNGVPAKSFHHEIGVLGMLADVFVDEGTDDIHFVSLLAGPVQSAFGERRSESQVA